jgi:lipid A disaccharide synthetase
MNQEVVKEHIQIIDPVVVADEVLALSVDSVARRKMLQHFEDLTSKLRPGASETAAQWIANDIQRRGQKV